MLFLLKSRSVALNNQIELKLWNEMESWNEIKSSHSRLKKWNVCDDLNWHVPGILIKIDNKGQTSHWNMIKSIETNSKHHNHHYFFQSTAVHAFKVTASTRFYATAHASLFGCICLRSYLKFVAFFISCSLYLPSIKFFSFFILKIHIW